MSEKENSVLEVKTIWDEREANKLLATQKWILLCGSIAHKDLGGFQAKACWLLGRIK